MDIFFQDPNDIPLPPEQVRIRLLRAEPLPDRRRVRIFLEVDPFLQRPNAKVVIANAQGEELARADVIESMTRKMEFTLHLRGPAPGPGEELRISVVLFYTAPIPKPEETASETALVELPEPQVVDRAETSFTI